MVKTTSKLTSTKNTNIENWQSSYWDLEVWGSKKHTKQRLVFIGSLLICNGINGLFCPSTSHKADKFNFSIDTGKVEKQLDAKLTTER